MKTSIFLFLVLAVLIFNGCSRNVNIEEQNKAVVRNWFEEGWNKHNPDKINEFCTDNYVNHGASTKNADEWKQFVTSTIIAFPDIHFTINDQIAEGDKVVTSVTFNGTHKGESRGVQATNKKVIASGINIIRFVDGKADEDWGVNNIRDMLQSASGIDGVYESLPPLKGQAVIRNGHFIYLSGPSDGSGPMNSSAGTHKISGDTIKNVITYCTDRKLIGTSYWWKVRSWSGDTVTFEIMNEKGQITGVGRSVKLSN